MDIADLVDLPHRHEHTLALGGHDQGAAQLRVEQVRDLFWGQLRDVVRSEIHAYADDQSRARNLIQQMMSWMAYVQPTQDGAGSGAGSDRERRRLFATAVELERDMMAARR
jgi:hypothetical protein